MGAVNFQVSKIFHNEHAVTMHSLCVILYLNPFGDAIAF